MIQSCALRPTLASVYFRVPLVCCVENSLQFIRLASASAVVRLESSATYSTAADVVNMMTLPLSIRGRAISAKLARGRKQRMVKRELLLYAWVCLPFERVGEGEAGSSRIERMSDHVEFRYCSITID